ncbi:MAG TPA: glycine oxidase ThiO [Gammaproteobacteria bacterium]|nr:glycine oxidase ThiO [Gammaproteobacteria bacterium]
MHVHNTSHSYDCAVIGAGIVGMMCARELAKCGLKIALFDKGRAGMESSWAAGGILSPLYPWRESVTLQPLINLSQEMYPALAEQLRETTGIDPEWLQCGMFVFGMDRDELASAVDWASKRNQQTELLNVTALGQPHPATRQGSNDALFLPSVAQIRNPFLSEALKRDLESRGVTIYENTSVERLRTTAGTLQSVTTSQGDFRTGLAVTAMGAWNSDLIPALDIRPVRGQMLCYQAPAGLISSIILDRGTYIIPRKDGHLLVGSTLEEVGFNKNTSEDAARQLSSNAVRILPAIEQFPLVRHWAGLRPATRSGLPCICAHPDIKGLYLNVGHYRNGILLAPGSAQLLADIVMHRETSIDSARFEFSQHRGREDHPEAVQ